METKNSLINMKNFNPIPFLVYHFFIALMLLPVGLFGQNISNASHFKKSEYIRPICVDETAKDTLALEYVEITDSTLLYLIDDAISKDSMCPYFDSCIAVNVRFYGVTSDTVVLENEYAVHISLWNSSFLLIGGEHVAYFQHNGHYGFIVGAESILNTLPSYLYRKTGKTDFFIYDESSMELMFDDGHSLYVYWLIDDKWYLGKGYSCSDW